MTLKEEGTFKSVEELQALYTNNGVTSDKEVISYCIVGGRSNHTWFVLLYLLGYPKVRLYDGSWAEWSTLIGAPIEKQIGGLHSRQGARANNGMQATGLPPRP